MGGKAAFANTFFSLQILSSDLQEREENTGNISDGGSFEKTPPSFKIFSRDHFLPLFCLDGFVCPIEIV